MGDGGDAAKGTDVLADVLDGEFRDVGAPGLDAAVAEGFDEKAESAAGVEGGLRLQVLDEGVGDGTEKTKPIFVVLVRVGTEAGAVILGVVGGRAGFAGLVIVSLFSL